MRRKGGAKSACAKSACLQQTKDAGGRPCQSLRWQRRKVLMPSRARAPMVSKVCALASCKASALVRALTECLHCAAQVFSDRFAEKLVDQLARGCTELHALRMMACSSRRWASCARRITFEQPILLEKFPNLPPLLSRHILIFLPWVRTMLTVNYNRCVLADLDPTAPQNVIIPDAHAIQKFTDAGLKTLLAACDQELALTNPQVEAKLRMKRKRSAPAER